MTHTHECSTLAQVTFYCHRQTRPSSRRVWTIFHGDIESTKERSQAPTTVPLGRFSSSPQLLRHQTNMNHHSYITIINLKTHLHDSHVTRHHITSKLPKLLNHKTKHGAILLTSQDLHCELTHTALPAPPLAPHPNCGILPE